MHKGIYLSFEAILSMLILVSLLIVLQGNDFNEGKKLDDLYIIQKSHDLIKVASIKGNFNEEELAEDFEFVFNGMSGEVILNGNELLVNEKSSEAIVVEAAFFKPNLERIDVKVKVFRS